MKALIDMLSLTLILCATMKAQDTWRLAATPGAGPAGAVVAMAADEVRGRVVLVQSGATYMSTSEWDGLRWTQRNPAQSPPNRIGHRLVYDSVRMVTMLYGGAVGSTAVQDVWLWDGSNWTSAGLGPPARHSHAMAFDPVRNIVMVFGGYRSLTRLNDTWQWDGNSWVELRSTQFTPPARSGHGLAFDPGQNMMLLFGGGTGVQLNDTWFWNHGQRSWYRVTPASSPPVREGFSMAYDSTRRRIVIFGGHQGDILGYTYLNDTWEWYGSNWFQRQPTASPSARTMHQNMAYDAPRRELVLFGGYVYPPATYLSDTWVYSPPSQLNVDFVATPLSGTPPLTVQFSDLSSTADPGGIRSWSWDLDGDGVPDSTARNPTHIYQGCGRYSVRLEVSDGWNGARSVTKPDYIVTGAGPITAAFSWQPTAIAPNHLQFQDGSFAGLMPPPLGTPVTAWAWDFDNDGVVDRTDQNPSWTFPLDWNPHPVRLTASIPGCGSASISLDVFSSNLLDNGLTGGAFFGSGSMAFCDIDVLEPEGIAICGLDVFPFSTTGTLIADIYLADTTWQGKATNPGSWALLIQGATGSVSSSPFSTPRLTARVSTPAHVPSGRHGLAVHFRSTTVLPSAATGLPVADANLQLSPGTMSTGLFSGTMSPGRIWNGGLRYLDGWRQLEWIEPGCAGARGVPIFDSPTLEVFPGANMRLDLNQTSARWGALYVGFSRQIWSGGALPFELSAFNAPGCYLLISPDVLHYFGLPPIPDGRPPEFLSIRVPVDPQLVGVTTYFQWLLLQDPSGVAIVTSRALAARINAR